MVKPVVTWMLAAMVLVAIAAAEARACPPGTRFSAYNGSGTCVILGQGKRAAVTCQIAKGSCPKGTTREHSNSDPKRDYCCPKQGATNPPSNPFETCNWFGTAPFCNGRCPAGFRSKIASTTGDGEKCVTGLKVLCCQNTHPGASR